MAEYIWGELVIDSHTDAFGTMFKTIKECGERRELITRCRDCVKSERRGLRLYCKAPMGRVGYAEVCDDDFCSCGAPREAVE